MPWVDSLPHGLDSKLATNGAGLSAGEGQLLALARLFLKDPNLVILDEASSRLDPATEALLEHALDTMLVNRTAIIIAHRLATVRRADKILILEEGTIKEMGDYQTLANNPTSTLPNCCKPVLRRYWYDNQKQVAANHTTTEQSTARPLTHFGRLMRAVPMISLAVCFFNTLDMTLPLLFGLILREFFNVLAGEANMGWGIWALVLLFLLNRIGVQIAELGAAGSSGLPFLLYRIPFETKSRSYLGRGYGLYRATQFW